MFPMLIPKKGGFENIKDFRPISSIDSLYKLQVKILVNKLQKVIGKVIFKFLNAFVKVRQIFTLLANEAIDLRAKSLRSGCDLYVGH